MTAPDDSAPEVAPLDVDGVGAVAVGTVLWTIALVACLVFRTQLADAGNAWWTWVCIAGVLLGLAGLVFVRRRRDAYRRAGAS
ncbi:MAG: DUF2530 domain-containing protein, partial [Candidatus Nanopelagicales bacterium]